SSAGTPLSRERAYDNEELPDYIMVMVANKKNPKQMADDLSLFLGSNTIKFTPTSLHPSDPHSETSIPAENNRRAAEPRALAISSSRSDKLEGRVSSSAHENRTRGSSERPSRLTSAVKPLMEASAEAVIDIKPDLDDDLIAYDPMEQSLTSQALYSRSTADRPRPALESSRRTADAYRSSDVTRGQERSGSSHGRGYRSSAESSRVSEFRFSESISSELSRKRKAPVASSVVRVHRGHERGQESDDLNEEEDEDEEDYGIASKVSLPLKPERKPSLPPAKQANKNLILKAISEAQKSINKTTTYTVPQRQTVPVAPRTRSASDEMNNAAIRLVQEHLHALTPQDTLHNSECLLLKEILYRELNEVEDMDVEPVQAKRQKLPERCRFWPACKSGDECLYHHPNTQCKIFPNCKFGNKCLFIHPNCKFDAKCTKADCPFTHVSRKLSSNPTRAAPASSVCHFFPECKKLDCPFYHPKPCRFAAQCKRAGCTFYHPAVAVPPRSALKWTKTQNR
uniref:Zinc finger CCCH domain-containing protein 14 n=1 Tax=Sinocyclocheilus grahami TaxID=75366 RepID=A0A672RKE7_SINGR